MKNKVLWHVCLILKTTVVLTILCSFTKSLIARQVNDGLCKKYENKIVSYIDLVYWVQKCKIRNISSSVVINYLTMNQKKIIEPIPEKDYASLEIGKEYTLDDYYNEFGKKETPSLANLCKMYKDKVVTYNNIEYFWIESCKKRKFDGYKDVLLFSKKIPPIYSLSRQIINEFPNGDKIVINKNSGDELEPTATQISDNLPSAKSLCQKIHKKIVSFHSGIYFLDNCSLRSIDDFNIDIQKIMNDLGGVQELTVEQVLGIPDGANISAKDVIKKLNSN